MKILFDTDIGTDIDDAVCLAYLLAQPRCELIGITTVTERANQRAQMASALCRVAGKDVPIFPGTRDPLLVRPRQTGVPQARALERWEHRTDFPQGEAIAFLRRTIRENPGEVTLLATGPMTNVALLFATDPEIPSLLKSLVLMCGTFIKRLGLGGVEWNALCDPHAAAMVYRAAVSVHRSLGLDVTEEVVLPKADVLRRFGAPLLQPVLDFAAVWFAQSERIVFHDPLAAATIFDEAICGFERGEVEVETESARLAGFTHWRPDPQNGPHEIATRVNAAHYFEHFFRVF
jgi:inosine-uridine nucleoside N-ribohydrolase